MWARRLVSLVAATALASSVGIGLAGTASAAPAVPVPIQDLPPIHLGVVSGPGVNFDTNCLTNPEQAFLGTDPVALDFTSGSAVLYRIADAIPPLPAGGGNIVGVATLLDNGAPSPYSGEAHVWFGTNTNDNGHLYRGETVSFHGAALDGSTVTITANPGGNTSASGNESGWFHEKVTCT